MMASSGRALLVLALAAAIISNAVSARSPSPSKRRPPATTTTAVTAVKSETPQYAMAFGRCGVNLQQQKFTNWDMYRDLSEDTPGSLVLYLDTKNKNPVASVFGDIDPESFPIRGIYIAYWDPKDGVKLWSEELDNTHYKETTSYYGMRIDGVQVTTVRDHKDEGIDEGPLSSFYCLKSKVNILPADRLYRIEIFKLCRDEVVCNAIPDPADVFRSPAGDIVWSAWSVGQSMTVNGTWFRDHAWCPVKTVVHVLQ